MSNLLLTHIKESYSDIDEIDGDINAVDEIKYLFEDSEVERLTVKELEEIFKYVKPLGIEKCIIENLAINRLCQSEVYHWIAYEMLRNIKEGDVHDEFTILEKVVIKINDESVFESIWNTLNAEELNERYEREKIHLFQIMSDNKEVPRWIQEEMLKIEDVEITDNIEMFLHT
jgi:hypothetical protein